MWCHSSSAAKHDLHVDAYDLKALYTHLPKSHKQRVSSSAKLHLTACLHCAEVQVLTITVYLNSDWDCVEQGGALRLHTQPHLLVSQPQAVYMSWVAGCAALRKLHAGGCVPCYGHSCDVQINADTSPGGCTEIVRQQRQWWCQ